MAGGIPGICETGTALKRAGILARHPGTLEAASPSIVPSDIQFDISAFSLRRRRITAAMCNSRGRRYAPFPDRGAGTDARPAETNRARTATAPSPDRTSLTERSSRCPRAPRRPSRRVQCQRHQAPARRDRLRDRHLVRRTPAPPPLRPPVHSARRPPPSTRRSEHCRSALSSPTPDGAQRRPSPTIEDPPR